MSTPELITSVDWNALLARIEALELGGGHPILLPMRIEPQNGATWSISAGSKESIFLTGSTQDCFGHGNIPKGFTEYRWWIWYTAADSRNCNVWLQQLDEDGGKVFSPKFRTQILIKDKECAKLLNMPIR